MNPAGTERLRKTVPFFRAQCPYSTASQIRNCQGLKYPLYDWSGNIFTKSSLNFQPIRERFQKFEKTLKKLKNLLTLVAFIPLFLYIALYPMG